MARIIVALGAAYLTALAYVFPLQGIDGKPAIAAGAPHPLVGRYCMSCHDAEEHVAGLSFADMSLDNIGRNAATWEKVLRKVGAGVMPPLNSPRPDAAELTAFISEVSSKLDQNAAPLPPPTLRRLNRTEYANAIRDLIGLEIAAEDYLPPDSATAGFDNIAHVQSSSPALIQSYIDAGMKISRIATGDPHLELSRAVYRAPGKLRQGAHIEGLPLGTRGGMRAQHFFPVDGVYEIAVRSAVGGFIAGRRAQAPMPDIDLRVDGKRVALGDEAKVRLKMAAGQRVITAALVDKVDGAGVNDLFSKYLVKGLITDISVNGPVAAPTSGNSAQRRSIFTCQPRTVSEERPCARTILARLGSRAFRRPLDAQGEEIGLIMRFYDEGRRAGGFEQGVRSGLAYILVDPRFIYRFEQPGAQVTGVDLASRLSFFLWSSIPDRELLDLGASGELNKPRVLEAQVTRMLGDPKAKALVDNFAAQWLHLRDLRSAERESADFDDNLRLAFETETKSLFRYMMDQNRSIIDLIDADYTFLNERLARHYGIKGVRGDYFRKVDLPKDSVRRGLLGQGSILTVTSVANRTSPVIRGAWVLENILGVKPPPPPPGVETNLDVNVDVTSLRQRLAIHRENKTCASCHNMMDPIGLALENYDLTGRWRATDGKFKVDASGVMADGTSINGPQDLRAAILNRQDAFVHTFIEKLMTFALGRELTYADMPEVRRISVAAKDDGNRLRSIVKTIVESPQFSAGPTRAADPKRTVARGVARGKEGTVG